MMEELISQLIIVVIPVVVTCIRKISKDFINPKHLPIILPLLGATVAVGDSVFGTDFAVSIDSLTADAVAGAVVAWSSIGLHQTFRKIKKKP